MKLELPGAEGSCPKKERLCTQKANSLLEGSSVPIMDVPPRWPSCCCLPPFHLPTLQPVSHSLGPCLPDCFLCYRDQVPLLAVSYLWKSDYRVSTLNFQREAFLYEV